MPPPNITERPQPPPFPPATLSPHNNHTISICNQTSPVSSSSHSEPYMNTCYPIYPYVPIPTNVYPPPQPDTSLPLVTSDGGYQHPPLCFPHATGVYPPVFPDGSPWYPTPQQLTEEHCRHHSPPSLMAMECPPSPPPHNVYPPPPAI
ncbi:unnamed protein product [Cuscuta epithymum]|uniref:Uncharacterized protein n=1 Tax=Cuscuta epithymum TaxID=186058 RepID=A0AAV0F8P8_9ASTE|nr:unnamed protein product [Cuscuta epithymum]